MCVLYAQMVKGESCNDDHVVPFPLLHPSKPLTDAPLREGRAFPFVQADRLPPRQLHQHLAGARVLLRAEAAGRGKVPLRPKERVLQRRSHHARVAQPPLEREDGLLLVAAELERIGVCRVGVVWGRLIVREVSSVCARPHFKSQSHGHGRTFGWRRGWRLHRRGWPPHARWRRRMRPCRRGSCLPREQGLVLLLLLLPLHHGLDEAAALLQQEGDASHSDEGAPRQPAQPPSPLHP